MTTMIQYDNNDMFTDVLKLSPTAFTLKLQKCTRVFIKMCQNLIVEAGLAHLRISVGNTIYIQIHLVKRI